MYRSFFKRFLDIVLSCLGIAVLGIPMLFIALAIRIDDPGPAVFTQTRVGKKKNGELSYFSLYKFRTMKMSAPHNVPTHLLENSGKYITRVGRVLRMSSADELMQLFNILAGQMSVVGPRPALWNQDDLIAERETYGANDITPGLTGLAQIRGRDEIGIAQKARLDGEYAGRITLKTDWMCFWKTIWNVLRHEGVVEGSTRG